MMITPKDLAMVSEEHRRVVTRWLLERAEQYRPSLVLTAAEATLIAGVLTGVAIDLMTPSEEDSTLMHAGGRAPGSPVARIPVANS